MRRPILMSRTNPTGEKLEDLLSVVIEELNAKTGALGKDERPAAQTLRTNNNQIVSLLKQAKTLQDHSLTVLADMGPDQGPRGKPRVGEGSEGYDPAGTGIRRELGRHGVGT